jgi:hypothetical protein
VFTEHRVEATAQGHGQFESERSQSRANGNNQVLRPTSETPMEDSQVDSKHVNLILGVVSSFGKPMGGLMPQWFTDSIKEELWQEVEVSGDFEVSDAAP